MKEARAKMEGKVKARQGAMTNAVVDDSSTPVLVRDLDKFATAITYLGNTQTAQPALASGVVPPIAHTHD